MTIATQAELFPSEAPSSPSERAWYPIRFTGYEVITSPTQGQMYRLRGAVESGPFAGLVVWKPLTHSMAGIYWCEKQLRAFGWGAYELARVRDKWGVGRYLEGLMVAVTNLSEVEGRIYAYDHPTEGRFWTLKALRKGAGK